MTVSLAVGADVAVRFLETGDRGAAATLIRSVDLFSEAEKDVALEVMDAYMEHPGEDYHALGAFTHRDVLLGYACYGPTPCTAGTWDLYWIAVSGEARGRGIGTLLMEEMERRLVEMDARLLLIETSSRADYAPTRGFYERRGYEVVAKVPDFYAPGDDRVIFARTFTPCDDEHSNHVQLAGDSQAEPGHRR
jgi:ribosomal protein S18 acetylase RimI-like enzyme